MAKDQYHHGDLKNALIQAGAEILLAEGVGSLSLRKVASRAGVSHSAPYAHFADKQALIAAISTEGFRQLYQRMRAAIESQAEHPEKLVLAAGYAYVQFGLESPAYFKLMFSGFLERESDFPEFVALSRQNFQLLVDMVQQCQEAGVLPNGAPDVLALKLWSQVHGFTALLIDRQISHHILDQYAILDLLQTVMG